ncbi:MAG: hypothetical protein MST03_03345 [Bacteroidales bacterium]|nr:hypothetical protein [Bacteroidales bacterium]
MKKRLLISVVLLASILGALPLCAQESCYAEYLREHNMSVLTAEDADDSYDELKKAVLAWQLYGSEASLPFAPKEEPAIPQLQDTTCVIVHLALVDSTWYMWMSVDPLSDKYPGNTPYLYCNGNPIILVDPDGRNPIYDLDGNLIGTDEKGQQGSPIVMDSKLFTQGMSQEEAMGFDVGVDFLATEKKIVLQENHMRLSNRPDWDGRLNLFEANNWYRNGNGKPLFVDASKIDLSPLMKSDFSKIGSLYVNFLSLENLNLQTGLVYGTIKVSMINNEGMVRIGNQSGLLDVYNFDMQNGRGFRNFATILGSIVAGKGTSFNIYCYGQAKIK